MKINKFIKCCVCAALCAAVCLSFASCNVPVQYKNYKAVINVGNEIDNGANNSRFGNMCRIQDKLYYVEDGNVYEITDKYTKIKARVGLDAFDTYAESVRIMSHNGTFYYTKNGNELKTVDFKNNTTSTVFKSKSNYYLSAVVVCDDAVYFKNLYDSAIYKYDLASKTAKAIINDAEERTSVYEYDGSIYYTNRVMALCKYDLASGNSEALKQTKKMVCDDFYISNGLLIMNCSMSDSSDEEYADSGDNKLYAVDLKTDAKPVALKNMLDYNGVTLLNVCDGRVFFETYDYEIGLNKLYSYDIITDNVKEYDVKEYVYIEDVYIFDDQSVYVRGRSSDSLLITRYNIKTGAKSTILSE